MSLGEVGGEPLGGPLGVNAIGDPEGCAGGGSLPGKDLILVCLEAGFVGIFLIAGGSLLSGLPTSIPQIAVSWIEQLLLR